MSREFNGTTDRIDWSSVDNLTGDPITISAWIYLDTLSGSDYITCFHQSGNTAIGIVFYVNSAGDYGEIVFYRQGSTALIKGGRAVSAITGGWHHVLVTHDGVITTASSVHIYIDGTERTGGANQNGATEATSSGSWSVCGRIYDDLRNFDGKVAEIAVWSSVLDGDTITALASGDVPSNFPTNLQFYYSAKADNTTAETGGAAATVDGTSYSSDHPLMDYFSSLAGAITPAGTLINSARKILAGVLDWAGDLATQFIGGSGTEYEQAVSGELTSSGALINSVRKILSGTLTSAGVALKRAARALDGSITPTTSGVLSKTGLSYPAGTLTSAGDVTKRTIKPLAGALTSEGVVGTVKAALKALSGELTSAGAVVLRTGKTLAGTIAPDGGIIKRTAKTIAGELTSSGALNTIKAALMAIGGTLTSAGTLALRPGKALSGALSPDGGLARWIRKTFSGAVTPSGVVSSSTTSATATPGNRVVNYIKGRVNLIVNRRKDLEI